MVLKAQSQSTYFKKEWIEHEEVMVCGFLFFKKENLTWVHKSVASEDMNVASVFLFLFRLWLLRLLQHKGERNVAEKQQH